MATPNLSSAPANGAAPGSTPTSRPSYKETFESSRPLKKQIGWSRGVRRLLHFRTSAGREVDAVLEDHSGRLVGVEVKASGTLGAKDFQGLEKLKEVAGEAFHRGIVLYQGERRLPFGTKLVAMPLQTLWSAEPLVGRGSAP